MLKSAAALVVSWNALSFNRRLAAIIGVGFILRLLWALAVPVIPESDSYIYWVTAGNLVNHGHYGVTLGDKFSFWPVGTSAIYAVFFLMFGVNMTAAVIANLIAAVLSIFTSALLAKRWFGEREALWTAGLMAVWPTLILYATVMASEVFFIVAINTALLVWNSRALPAAGASVLSGVTFGLAALLRPVALLVPVVFAIMTAAKERKIFPQAWRLAVVMIAMFAAIAPWTARNYDVHGAFVLIATNGGTVLWMGNNPDSTGAYTVPPTRTDDMTEVERAEVLGEEAKAYMLANPVRTVIFTARKLIDTHLRETIAVHWNMSGIEQRFGAGAITPFKLVTQAWWMVVFLVSLGGATLAVLAALKEKTLADKFLTFIASPALGLWAYYAVVHAVIISGDRYHMQSIPFIAMLASLAVTTALAKLKSRAAPTPQAEGA
jgi:4-amino-4-deoxy-L-arabinose transferase-like glycosyltransferase